MMDQVPEPKAPKSTGEAGFSLADVLVGTTILVIGVLGMAGAATSAHQVRRTVSERKAVHDAIETELKTIESTSFEDLWDHDGRGFAVGEGVEARAGDADGMPGRVTVRVPAPPNDAAELLEVEVSVDGDGGTGRYQMTRVIQVSRIGLIQ